MLWFYTCIKNIELLSIKPSYQFLECKIISKINNLFGLYILDNAYSKWVSLEVRKDTMYGIA